MSTKPRVLISKNTDAVLRDWLKCHQSEHSAYAYCWLVGTDNDNIARGLARLRPIRDTVTDYPRGCRRMIAITPEELDRAIVLVTRNNLNPTGIARVGSWNTMDEGLDQDNRGDSGDALFDLNTLSPNAYMISMNYQREFVEYRKVEYINDNRHSIVRTEPYKVVE